MRAERGEGEAVGVDEPIADAGETSGTSAAARATRLLAGAIDARGVGGGEGADERAADEGAGADAVEIDAAHLVADARGDAPQSHVVGERDGGGRRRRRAAVGDDQLALDGARRDELVVRPARRADDAHLDGLAQRRELRGAEGDPRRGGERAHRRHLERRRRREAGALGDVRIDEEREVVRPRREVGARLALEDDDAADDVRCPRARRVAGEERARRHERTLRRRLAQARSSARLMSKVGRAVGRVGAERYDAEGGDAAAVGLSLEHVPPQRRRADGGALAAT